MFWLTFLCADTLVSCIVCSTFAHTLGLLRLWNEQTERSNQRRQLATMELKMPAGIAEI